MEVNTAWGGGGLHGRTLVLGLFFWPVVLSKRMFVVMPQTDTGQNCVILFDKNLTTSS